MRSYASAIALLLALRPSLWAAGGSTSLDFLSLDADARPAGLGGAYSALARDANALHYNPAGLGLLKGHEARLMHASLPSGASQDYAALGLRSPLPWDRGVGAGFGATINTAGSGRIARTTISNPTGHGLAGFDSRGWAMAVGYGRKPAEGWPALGADLKYLREDLDDVSAWAVAADVGALAEYALPWDATGALGLAVQNIGGGLRFHSGRESLPLILRMGAALRVRGEGTLGLELRAPRGDKPSVHAGAEYVLMSAVALRLGYNGRTDVGSNVTGGAGLRLNDFGLDYAFTPHGALGSAHRLSLNYSWGQPPRGPPIEGQPKRP